MSPGGHRGGAPQIWIAAHPRRAFDVEAPLLFFQGSRDTLSRSELFDQHVRPLANATVVDMEGADHSFRGRGWTPERVHTTVVEGYEAWLEVM